MTRHDSIKLRHKRLRKKVSGTTERPRLAVNFSGRHIRAQVIDDTKGVTLAAASTQEKAAKAGANVANATSVGQTGGRPRQAKIHLQSRFRPWRLPIHGQSQSPR